MINFEITFPRTMATVHRPPITLGVLKGGSLNRVRPFQEIPEPLLNQRIFQDARVSRDF